MAAATAVVTLCGGLRPADAQQPQKPNILFIMGDDIGWMQPSIYHQGLMVGETPNIDRIGLEGAKFLIDLGYNTGEFGKNHLGDHTDALPTAHGFQEFWGYLYHLDAMQGVSFP